MTNETPDPIILSRETAENILQQIKTFLGNNMFTRKISDQERHLEGSVEHLTVEDTHIDPDGTIFILMSKNVTSALWVNTPVTFLKDRIVFYDTILKRTTEFIPE